MKNQLAERMLLRQLIEARDRAMQPWAGAKEARELAEAINAWNDYQRTITPVVPVTTRVSA